MPTYQPSDRIETGASPAPPLPFLPLPAKFHYKVAKPVRLPSGADLASDERLVQRAYASISATMQDMIDEIAARRRFPVLG